MTVSVETKEEEMGSLPIKPEDPSSYGCQILQEKTTLDAANDKTLPNDARLIWYVVDGVEYIDLTRCKKTSQLFDMYYDRYGKGAVQRIDFGYGTVNPKLWGYKSKDKKKNIFQINSFDEITKEILTDIHCFGCTAGAGSSCGGSLI